MGYTRFVKPYGRSVRSVRYLLCKNAIDGYSYFFHLKFLLNTLIISQHPLIDGLSVNGRVVMMLFVMM